MREKLEKAGILYNGKISKESVWGFALFMLLGNAVQGGLQVTLDSDGVTIGQKDRENYEYAIEALAREYNKMAVNCSSEPGLAPENTPNP